MRVISGSARGHKLHSPSGLFTRPTTDKIKEAIFSIVMNDLLGCEFLDLFSGTGAIGIEAISRGAKKATFVDSDKDSFEIISENLRKTKLFDKAEILKEDYLDAITKLAKKGRKFDLIFLDPPYHEEFVQKSIDLIFLKDILKSDGTMIIEMPIDLDVDIENKYDIIKEKKYGNTFVLFLKRVSLK